jgi:hypothetical protein
MTPATTDGPADLVEVQRHLRQELLNPDTGELRPADEDAIQDALVDVLETGESVGVDRLRSIHRNKKCDEHGKRFGIERLNAGTVKLLSWKYVERGPRLLVNGNDRKRIATIIAPAPCPSQVYRKAWEHIQDKQFWIRNEIAVDIVFIGFIRFTELTLEQLKYSPRRRCFRDYYTLLHKPRRDKSRYCPKVEDCYHTEECDLNSLRNRGRRRIGLDPGQHKKSRSGETLWDSPLLSAQASASRTYSPAEPTTFDSGEIERLIAAMQSLSAEDQQLAVECCNAPAPSEGIRNYAQRTGRRENTIKSRYDRAVRKLRATIKSLPETDTSSGKYHDQVRRIAEAVFGESRLNHALVDERAATVIPIERELRPVRLPRSLEDWMQYYREECLLNRYAFIDEALIARFKERDGQTFRPDSAHSPLKGPTQHVPVRHSVAELR